MVAGRPSKNPSSILQVACPYCEMRTSGLRAQADTGTHRKASQVSTPRALNSCLQRSVNGCYSSSSVSPRPLPILISPLAIVLCASRNASFLRSRQAKFPFSSFWQAACLIGVARFDVLKKESAGKRQKRRNRARTKPDREGKPLLDFNSNDAE